MKAYAAFRASRGHVAMAVYALLLAGALTGDGAIAPANAESISDKLNSWILGPPAKQAPAPNAPSELECPDISIRSGASTLAVSAPGTEASPMTTRYQATIGQTARECATFGGMITMKVGVQGRILLGPAGGPGQLDVPLRLAVVREGTEPKTIWTKFYKLPVAIPPGQTSVPFVHVAPDVTFPVPSGNELDAYVVYVGFDPTGLSTKPAPHKKGKRK
jgi:hypothetical protein